MVYFVIRFSAERLLARARYNTSDSAKEVAEAVSQSDDTGQVIVSKRGDLKPLCVFEKGRMVECNCPDAFTGGPRATS
jgi:hypothetical protein